MALKRNIAANYLGRAYSIGSIYIFTPFYIKFLGVESFGLIGFYSIILMVGALADLGLSATFSRETARQPDRARLLDLLVTVECALVGMTMVIAVILIVTADIIAQHWFNPSDTLPPGEIARCIRLMALAMVTQFAVSLYVSGLLGLQRQELGNGVQALFVTLRGGLVIPALYAVPSLELFFAWQLAAGLILVVVGRITLVRAMGFGPFAIGRASLATLRPVMGFAGAMFALTILSGINTQLDKVVVSKLFSIEEFGYYTLASTLAQLPFALISPLMVALLPRLTELGSAGQTAKASNLYDGFIYLVAVLAGLSGFGLAFFAPELLSLWLGTSVIPEVAVKLVRILAVGSLLLSVASPPFYLGLAYGHSRTSIVTSSLTLLVTIPLLLVASSQFGLVGAALPWVVLNAASLLALSWNIHRRFYHGRANPVRWIVLPLLVSALALGASRLVADRLDTGPLGSCIIAGLIGGAALFLLVLAAPKRLGLVRVGP